MLHTETSSKATLLSELNGLLIPLFDTNEFVGVFTVGGLLGTLLPGSGSDLALHDSDHVSADLQFMRDIIFAGRPLICQDDENGSE